MSAHAQKEQTGSLVQIAHQVAGPAEKKRRAPSNRRVPRLKPVQPTYIRVLTPSVPVTLEPYGLKDISENGIGIYSPHYFDPESIHRIEVCTEQIGWIGYMRVAYCLMKNSKYLVGLEALNKEHSLPNDSAIRVAPKLQYNDSYDMVVSPQRQWLEQTRQEIAETFRAYCRARHTFGFLGNRVEDVVNRYLATIPEGAADKGHAGRRKSVRKRTNTKAHLILVGADYWHGLAAHVINVSKDGAGIVIPAQVLRALPEALRQNLLSEHPDVKVIFGLAAGRELLWLPGRVMYLRLDDEGRLCFGGLKFERKPFEIARLEKI